MKSLDLYAIGNALVDSEYEVTQEQLELMGIDKGHMTLIDVQRRSALESILSDIKPRQTGGGSAGNTVVALAQLGGSAFYSCRVADDRLGHFYQKDLQTNGVLTNLSTQSLSVGQTGTCMVMVTPDAQRSMNTFLGSTSELDESSLNIEQIQKSRVYYMEGYLAASPTGLGAALKGRKIAEQAGVALATTLSDVSMIKFCRAGLQAMVGTGLTYLFCNEEEAQVWCDTLDLNQIKKVMSSLAKVVCITRGSQGCLILENGQTTEVQAPSVQAVDTNGAGDMFAGAFLYGCTSQDQSHADAAWLANQAAARVVSQHGNRLTLPTMQELRQHFDGRMANILG